MKVFVTYNGETLCLKDWSRKLGIKYNSLHWRIREARWKPERALTEPARKYNYKSQPAAK